VSAPADDPIVHDAIGPPLSGREAAAALGVGINSLLVLGIQPVLLGALADEHRIAVSGIGLAAMLELLAMGVTTALAGVVRKPGRLKTVAFVTALALAGVNLATAGASGVEVFALRTSAGALEGILLWITVAMIVRTQTPERWAGVFFTTQTLAQLVLAMAMAVVIMPRFGVAGGFVALAAVSLLGLAPALLTPSRYAPLPVARGEGGAPPPRGWVALAATLIFVASSGAISVYLQPLAHQAGLGSGVARTANWISLAAQVAGGASATMLAGRIRYFTVFVVASAIYLAVWCVFGLHPAASLFIAANAVAGYSGIFLAPFLVPMIIDADPSRRAGVQSGAAQLLGGALGPLLASLVVGDKDVHAVLWLGAGLLLAGLTGVAVLRFTKPRLAAEPL
jgi:hypothetical protein